MSEFLQEWLKSRDVDPRKLSKQAVVNDRWDRKYYNGMLDSLEDFVLSHEALCEKVDTGSPMWADVFWLLWKVDPKRLGNGEMRPDHLINSLVGKELEALPDYERTKYFTEGDEVAASMACVDLRETLETIFDKLHTLRDALKKAMELASSLYDAEQEKHDVDDMVERWREGYNPDEENEELATAEAQQAELNAQIEEMRAALEEAANEVDEEENAAGPFIRKMLQGPMEEAANGAQAMHGQDLLWGTEEGSQQRLSAEERIKLAQKLRNGKLKYLLDFIGPLRRMMESSRVRPTDLAVDEVVGITLGNDLSRVLPGELAKIHHPLARYEFYRKYLERELPIYETSGEERVGRGKMIACIDTSGSMHGEKEMWGKAVALCALHLARQQKRAFYGINFASANEIREYDFGINTDFNLDMILDFAEFNFWGGTNFETPLSVALDQLMQEHAANGKVDGDIIFITDGLYTVNTMWLKKFKKEQARLGFQVWAFKIGGYSLGQLEEICDGRVVEVSDLLNPEVTATMWNSVGRNP